MVKDKGNIMSIKKSQELKQLQSRKAKLEVYVEELSRATRESQREYDKARFKMKALDEEIKRFSDSNIIVSEHAVLRYMERVMGFDLEMVRSAILSPDNLMMIKKLGAGKYPLPGGGRIVVKDNVIVSIVD